MKLKIMVLGLVLVFFNAGYAMAEAEEPVNTEASEHSVSEEEAPKYCPICGPEEETHGLALGYKYKGKKYTFCSMECLKAFKKNPEKFLTEMNPVDNGDHNHESHDH